MEAGSSTQPFPSFARGRGSRLQSIAGGSAGNLIEWYDWYAWASFSLYFAPVFFPSGDRTSQLMSAAAIFAVGFLMRPLGAWMMGIYADKFGRKRALTVSVMLMCLGSLLIAAAPPYAVLGVLAPAILVVARLLQGLSIGGEYGASAVYLSEMAHHGRRCFYSSFQYVTLIAGQLLALCVLLLLQSVLPDDQMRAWGWRIPFVLGGMMAVVVVVMRRRMAETPAFEGVAGAETRPGLSLALVREHPRAVLLVMALTAGGTLAFYAYSVYMQKFLVNTAGLSVATASRVMTAALFLFMLVQPLAGLLSDRVGRKPLLIGFGVAGVLGTVPIFRALETVASGLEAFPLVMAALIIVTGYSATGAVVKSELFPAHIRTLGVALPYALANTVFGGTAEYVALWFKSIGHESGFYWYVTGVIGLSLIAYLLMRETMHRGSMAAEV